MVAPVCLFEGGEMKAPRSLRWIGLALGLMFVLLAPLPSLSQSCALCYTQAASAGARMIQALRSGILVLVVPPTLMSVGMIFVVWHKNGQVRHNGENDDSGQDWQKQDWQKEDW
jgi:hypothetical protein